MVFTWPMMKYLIPSRSDIGFIITVTAIISVNFTFLYATVAHAARMLMIISLGAILFIFIYSIVKLPLERSGNTLNVMNTLGAEPWVIQSVEFLIFAAMSMIGITVGVALGFSTIIVSNFNVFTLTNNEFVNILSTFSLTSLAALLTVFLQRISSNIRIPT